MTDETLDAVTHSRGYWIDECESARKQRDTLTVANKENANAGLIARIRELEGVVHHRTKPVCGTCAKNPCVCQLTTALKERDELKRKLAQCKHGQDGMLETIDDLVAGDKELRCKLRVDEVLLMDAVHVLEAYAGHTTEGIRVAGKIRGYMAKVEGGG